MTNPNFGLQFIQVDDQPQPVIGANLDVVGIIGPCSTADPNKFPLDTPVIRFSNDITLAKDLGTDGFILDAIEGINTQLADFEAAAQLVIVRTDYGTAGDINLKLQQTIAKIMGQSTAGTGIWAFLKAPNTLYCTPRLITAPGYTGQMANSLDTLTINASGVGYVPGQEYVITFAQGVGETNGANLVLPQAHAIADPNGEIHDTELFIDSFGAWFTVAPTATMPAPDGPTVTAQPAQGALIFSRNPGVGASITLNGTSVAFTSGAPVAGASRSGATLSGGTTGVSATGYIDFAFNPSNGDTITLNGTVVTFVTATPSGNQVQIGVNLAATLGALVTFLNASADTEIAKCTYTAANGNTRLAISFDVTGTSGNSYTLATSVSSTQVQLGADLGTTLTNLMTRLTTSTDQNLFANTYQLNQGTIVMTQKANGIAGNGYTLATNVTGLSLTGPHLTGGRDAASSSTATLFTSMALGANPVVAELTPVLNQLIGHAVVESAGTSFVADLNWRDTINSERIIPLSGGIKVIDPISGSVVVRPLSPRMIGVMIARDFSTGYPFHSAANRPIQGVVSPARTIAFNLIDGANEGQQLLGANIGIVVRGLIGVETAISSGGFVLISTDNAGDSELWRMYNVKRGRDYIHLSLMPALRTYLGRTNITRQTIVNILATISDFLSNLKALEQIIDYRVNFKGSFNSAAEIRKGHLTVGFQAEEAPVLKVITTMSARFKPAIDNMVKQIEQQLNIAA